MSLVMFAARLYTSEASGWELRANVGDVMGYHSAYFHLTSWANAMPTVSLSPTFYSIRKLIAAPRTTAAAATTTAAAHLLLMIEEPRWCCCQVTQSDTNNFWLWCTWRSVGRVSSSLCVVSIHSTSFLWPRLASPRPATRSLLLFWWVSC